MNDYWDSFDCQIQCEEVYAEEPDLSELEETHDGNKTAPEWSAHDNR